MISTQLTQVAQQGLGNTKAKPPPKDTSRSRRWCLTLNNWKEENFTQIHSEVSSNCTKWIIGKEGEGKTPHLQCYLEYKNGKSFRTMKNTFPGCHIEKAKGNAKQNYEYCSKEGNFTSNFNLKSKEELYIQEILDDEYKDVTWKPWQQKVLDIIKQKPDRRKVYWFWEPTGNVGKSYLCKYLCLTRDVILCEGKKADIFNQVKGAIDAGKKPEIILCDIPRTAKEYINYGAIEQLKNGCLYSGKYEGGQILMKIPHVICFANTRPDMEAFSEDRWIIDKLF